MASELKLKIQEDMKAAMRAQDKERLAAIRLILAAAKQKEVDERVELTDTDMLAILDKMVKQRRESIAQYQTGNRQDLADKEEAEIQFIKVYLPAPLSPEEIDALIKAAIESSGAASVKDMGKVMGILKPQVQGRADVAVVSNKIKEMLSSAS